MATANTSPLLALALNDGFAPTARPPFGRLLAVSLSLHVGFLLVAGKIQFSSLGERPLVAQEVSLVSLQGEPRASVPPPRPKPAPTAAAPKTPAAPPNVIEEATVRSEALMQEALNKIKLPTPRVAEESAPSVELSQPNPPAEVPKPASPPAHEPDVRSKQVMQDALGKIELPPEAPTFEPLEPAPVRRPTAAIPKPALRAPKPLPRLEAPPPAPSPTLEREINSVLDKLAVPETLKPKAAPRRDAPVASPTRKARPSLSDSLKRELALLERLHQPKPVPRLATPPPAKTPRPAPPAVDKVAPQTQSMQPATAIHATGSSPGSSEYLARIQLKISQHWIAPPVDLSGRPLSVVIKFRLHRSGSISNVTVERSSGNSYYDLAARRAVLSADPLPPFPGSMADHFLDTHYTFSVKEPLS